MKETLLLLNVSLVLFFSCSKNKMAHSDLEGQSTVSIEGIWSYIENDSIYGEVIFTRDHLWEYTELSGEMYQKYVQKNDSVIILNWNGDRYISGRLTKNSSDKFAIERPNVKVRYEKLNILLDTARILRGDEEYTEEYVTNGLLVRKYSWEGMRVNK